MIVYIVNLLYVSIGLDNWIHQYHFRPYSIYLNDLRYFQYIQKYIFIILYTIFI